MHRTRLRSNVKSGVAVFCAACFLAMSMGSVTRVVAADDGFETGGAATAGDAAGRKTAAGMSAGTIGLIALGVGGAIAIAVAAGGGGSSSSPVCNQ
jgi:hypothetical protein